MKSWAFLFLSLVSSFALGAGALSPLYHRFIHGPLYTAIKLLIHEEQFTAERISNQTMYKLNETKSLLLERLEHMEDYNQIIANKTKELQRLWQQETLRKCFKSSEQDVAHFNRELLYKFDACSQQLQEAVDRLANDTLLEMAFIQSASSKIAAVPIECHIKSLRSDRIQSGVIICVASNLGQIKQRLNEFSALCFDILGDISFVTDEDGDASNCRDISKLRKQFETIYVDIRNCYEENS